MNDLLAINWIDGMKINKSHFSHNDKLYAGLMQERMALLMKSFEYGLLPLHESILQKPMVQVEDHLLKVNFCFAVNRKGAIIKIDESDKIEYDLKSLDQVQVNPGDQFIVVLSIESGTQLPWGEPKENEMPPRQPFVKPKYKINLVPESQVSSEDFANNFVCIARLKYADGTLVLDADYLPPCNQMRSYNALLDRYTTITNALTSIGDNTTTVLQKARSKKKRGEINDLAESTFYLMEKIVIYIAEHINAIRTSFQEESPMKLITFLSSLGKIILSSLMCLRSQDKEALLRYYESHLGLAPHQFESDMKELSQLVYEPLKATQTFELAIKHLTMLKNFASKATQLEFHSVERVDVVTESKVERKKLDIF